MTLRGSFQHFFGFGPVLFCLLVATIACDRSPAESGKANAQVMAEIPDELKAIMRFDEAEYNFGTVEEGTEVTHEYTFTNTGKSDLLISNAIASCGCTVPEWPKEPIIPGGKGKIKATFNSEGRPGQTFKSITITANTKDKVEIVLKGEVKPKSESGS